MVTAGLDPSPDTAARQAVREIEFHDALLAAADPTRAARDLLRRQCECAAAALTALSGLTTTEAALRDELAAAALQIVEAIPRNFAGARDGLGVVHQRLQAVPRQLVVQSEALRRVAESFLKSCDAATAQTRREAGERLDAALSEAGTPEDLDAAGRALDTYLAGSGENDPSAWLELGIAIWKRGGHPATAAEAFQEAAQLSEEKRDAVHVHALRRLAHMQCEQGAARDALTTIGAALGAVADPDLLAEACRYAAACGDDVALRAHARRCMELDPGRSVRLFAEPDVARRHGVVLAVVQDLKYDALTRVRKELAKLEDLERDVLEVLGALEAAPSPELATMLSMHTASDPTPVRDYMWCLHRLTTLGGAVRTAVGRAYEEALAGAAASQKTLDAAAAQVVASLRAQETAFGEAVAPYEPRIRALREEGASSQARLTHVSSRVFAATGGVLVAFVLAGLAPLPSPALRIVVAVASVAAGAFCGDRALRLVAGASRRRQEAACTQLEAERDRAARDAATRAGAQLAHHGRAVDEATERHDRDRETVEAAARRWGMRQLVTM